ncbi:MAG: two-component regulator propeller domain-containing protein [Candidatus Kapaibacterium sp.]
MKRTLFMLWCCLVFSATVTAQIRLESWRSHSSMNTATDITIDAEGNYWVSTIGGVFRFSPQDGAIEEFRNIDALSSMDCSTIAYDPQSKNIYIGSSNGDIDIYTSQGSWNRITDIRFAKNLTKKKINQFLFANNVVFVAGDFGFIDYSYSGAPGTYAQRIGIFPQQTEVKQMLVWNDSLVVVTPQGIAITALNNTSFGNPTTWRSITANQGLLNNDCHSATIIRDSLFIGHSKGISVYKNGIARVRYNTKQAEEFDNIITIDNNGDNIVMSKIFTIEQLDKGIIAQPTFHEFAKHKTIIANSTVMLFTFFTQNGGIGIQKDGKQEKFIPIAPFANLFTSLAVDNTGVLWASGDRDRGTGTYILDNGLWKNFNTSTRKDISENGTFKVATFSDGSVWLGSWGGGVTRVLRKDNDYEFTRFTNSNSPLIGLKNAPDFIVTGIVAKDRDNNTWVPAFALGDPGPTLTMINDQGNHKSFFAPLTLPRRTYTDVVIDANDTKWFASRDEDGLGYFNEKNTPDNMNDDVWGVLNTGNSTILDNSPSCLEIDKNGLLWIGTSAGLNVIYNTSNAARQGGKVTVSKLQTISNQVVRDIAVDAVNNKWIATNQGVFVLNEDGSEILATINIQNSPLVDNDVRAIAFDYQSGKVYFGTEKGLSEAVTLAVKPLDDFNISVYPQPFHPGSDTELIIEGLGENSGVHIVGIDGRPIRSLSTRSRKTVWDGKDEFGNYVDTGVYVVQGVSATTEKAGAAKISVLKK